MAGGRHDFPARKIGPTGFEFGLLDNGSKSQCMKARMSDMGQQMTQ